MLALLTFVDIIKSALCLTMFNCFLLKILLPTGTVVEININPGWPQFLEIDILPSTYDYKATTGLCGSFDGDKTNDRQGLSEREFSKTTK